MCPSLPTTPDGIELLPFTHGYWGQGPAALVTLYDSDYNEYVPPATLTVSELREWARRMSAAADMLDALKLWDAPSP